MSISILDNIKNGFDLEGSDENSKFVIETSIKKEEQVIPVKETPEFDFKQVFCPTLSPHNEGSVKDSINTGFDLESSLNYEPCSKQPYSKPLYKENFLSEFETEEEKKLARHNLGLYDTDDIVAMSLITTGDAISDKSILDELKIKVMKQGNIPFAVQTTASAVLVKQNKLYTPLQDVLGDYDISIKKTNSRIDQLFVKSTDGNSIKTIGDINSFLEGFKNNESLVQIVKDHLLFESKGIIEQNTWQI